MVIMEIPSGDSIRAARKDNRLTQSDLAERADVSQPLIARVESEDVDPTIDTLYSIVSALNDSSSNLEQEEVQISMPSVLKDARSQAGYTQRELANIADVSQPLISRIERQDVNPRASTLRELFSHLVLRWILVLRSHLCRPRSNRIYSRKSNRSLKKCEIQHRNLPCRQGKAVMTEIAVSVRSAL